MVSCMISRNQSYTHLWVGFDIRCRWRIAPASNIELKSQQIDFRLFHFLPVSRELKLPMVYIY